MNWLILIMPISTSMLNCAISFGKRRAGQLFYTNRSAQYQREACLTVEAPKDLPTEEDKKRLAYLQRRFVFTTVDKAGNNICIMCKKHYSATLCITVILVPSPS